jgi:hypothetical protein
MPSLPSRLVEFVSLRRAEATIRSYSPSQQERIALHHAAGDRRFRAARRASDSLAAAILYREAALSYLRAVAAVRTTAVGDSSPARVLLETETASLPLDPIGPPLAEEVGRVRAALGSSDSTFFDRLDRDELERTRSALERAAAKLGGSVEARSLVNVLGARVGRICACLLMLVAVARFVAVAVLWPDLAAGKAVSASSIKGGSPEDFVGGGLGTSFAIATNTQESPWIAVDLSRVYRVAKVEIYNRVDGWFDDNLPVALQTSIDGAHWNEVSRRTTTFGYAPPWTVRLEHLPARYLRVQGVGGHMALVLSKMRVYGAK